MPRETQRDVFLESEGDAWFARNREALDSATRFERDAIVDAIGEIVASPLAPTGTARLLEIGASSGRRLEVLGQDGRIEAHGIEPSQAAVDVAIERGLKVVRGTADTLPYEARSFDIVAFGFCLYLCDDDDLFRIAAEADRVLKDGGWIVIQDFYASTPVRRAYHHRAGLQSRKMDYRQLFAWHPRYVCLSHAVRHHVTGTYTDEPGEWVATAVLRKAPPADDVQ